MTAMIEGIAMGLELVGLIVGAIVAYQAFRGYRRNDSRAMFAIAVAIGLIAVGHAATRPAGWFAVISDLEAALLTQLLDVIAVLLIGYALIRS